MQRIFMVHGWTGNPSGDWFPWAKKELEKGGYEVFTPEMPDSDHPRIAPWVETIKEAVGGPKVEDIFVGHSIGCQAIERYLQTLPPKTKINRVILIAPWIVLTERTFDDLEEDRHIVKPWYDDPIEYEKIKKMASSWTAVFSDNDPYVKYEDNYKVYKDKLGAKIILVKGQYHFNIEFGITTLPILLELLK